MFRAILKLVKQNQILRKITIFQKLITRQNLSVPIILDVECDTGIGFIVVGDMYL